MPLHSDERKALFGYTRTKASFKFCMCVDAVCLEIQIRETTIEGGLKMADGDG